MLDQFHKKWGRLRKRPSKTGKDAHGLSTEQIYVPNITLPLELYRPIIEQVGSKQDLYNLLFVSRYFHVEAERVLYRTISFPLGYVSPQLSGFLERIPRCDRLALHVRDLQMGVLRGDFLNPLQQALRKMCNLRNLMLTSIHRATISLSGCGFQLHTLILDNLKTNDSAFLETQKELIELDIPRYCNLSLSANALPKLSILVASFPGSTYFANHRPLRALHFVEYPSFQLRQETVRSLRIPFSAPPEDFSAIVEAFPSLRYLSIEINIKPLARPYVQTLFALLSPLDSLEKLQVCISDVLSSEIQDAMVEDAFDILKSFQVLAIGTLSHPDYTQWVRGDKTSAGSYFYKNEGEWKDSRWS